MDKNEKAFSELQKGIANYVNNIIKFAPFDKTLIGVIEEVSDKFSTVTIDRIKYTNIPKLSFLTLSVGDVVKIKVPQNNMNNMYIEGKLG